MAEEIKQITPISDATKQGIKRKTAEMLPDNPTAAGMKAADIKAAFFKGLTDGNLSLVAELERVINEANEFFSTEVQMRSDADSNLTTELGAETAARESADTKIKATAVGVPTYNPQTGVLTFKTLDGEETVYDLPIEKIIESVSLSEDGQKFIFKFHNSADIEVDVNRLTNPAWESELKDSSIPPTSAAVKAAVDTKVDKLIPDSATYPHPYVYTVDKDNNHSLVRSNTGYASNTVVIRDGNGLFLIKPPTSPNHPVSKSYFDTKTNNSLYYDHAALERRVANVEYGSNGKLYDTVELNGSGSALQVDYALPYGILSRISGNVKTVSIGLPYDLARGSSNMTRLSDNSFTVPGGKMPYVTCKVPNGTTVTANYNLKNASISSYALFATKASSGRVADNTSRGYSCTLYGDSNYIGFSRVSNDLKNLEETVSDFRVIFDDPTKANVETVIEEIEIPEGITSLAGYGEEGSYLDLTERKFYRADGSSEDVSGDLPVECDVISLLPGSIIKFTDADGEPVVAEYSVSYKNKIGG